jgi:predicted  nucleic acid-binding Zn-ribbon protein
MDMMSGDPDRPTKTGLWTRLRLKFAAVNEGLLQECPPQDWDHVTALGEVQICVWVFQSLVFALAGHKAASAEHIRPDIIILAMFLAAMIAAVDSYTIARTGWFIDGMKALARGGLEIGGGTFARVKAALFLPVRGILSVGLAQITAILISTIIYGSDIASRLEHADQLANDHLVGPATTLVDGQIGRTADAVTTLSKTVNGLASQLATLRQSQFDPSANDHELQQAEQEVQQLLEQTTKAQDDVRNAESFATSELGGQHGHAGAGPKYKAAMDQVTNARTRLNKIGQDLAAARTRLETIRGRRSSAGEAVMQRAHDQLPALERTYDAENAKLANLKDELARLTAGRETAIRRAMENAPDYVPLKAGLLTQLSELEHIAEEDHKIALIIVLIEVVAFGIEISAILCKITAFVPTTYSALLMRESFMCSVKIVDEMTANLKVVEEREVESPDLVPAEPPSEVGEDPTPGALTPDAGPIDQPPQPPKRKRGRPLGSKDQHPRKHPILTLVKDSSGQEQSGEGPERPAPA